MASDDDVWEGSEGIDLPDGLLADDGLVQEDVIEDGAEGVSGSRVGDRVLDGLGDGDAEASGVIGLCERDGSSELGLPVSVARRVMPSW
jgi:hypothetical protein